MKTLPQAVCSSPESKPVAQDTLNTEQQQLKSTLTNVTTMDLHLHESSTDNLVTPHSATTTHKSTADEGHRSRGSSKVASISTPAPPPFFLIIAGSFLSNFLVAVALGSQGVFYTYFISHFQGLNSATALIGSLQLSSGAFIGLYELTLNLKLGFLCERQKQEGELLKLTELLGAVFQFVSSMSTSKQHYFRKAPLKLLYVHVLRSVGDML